jgi:hypothetical protein
LHRKWRNDRGGRHFRQLDDYDQCDSDPRGSVRILAIGARDGWARAMVHFPAVVRYSRPASHAGGSPAASAALPPHSNVPDARSAHVGCGRTGGLHYGAKDSHAYRSVHPYGDSDYGGWGHGNHNGQYKHFELSPGRLGVGGMLSRCSTRHYEARKSSGYFCRNCAPRSPARGSISRAVSPNASQAPRINGRVLPGCERGGGNCGARHDLPG